MKRLALYAFSILCGLPGLSFASYNYFFADGLQSQSEAAPELVLQWLVLE